MIEFNVSLSPGDVLLLIFVGSLVGSIARVGGEALADLIFGRDRRAR